MKTVTRFKRLTMWNKLGVVGAVCSILAFLGWLLWPKVPADTSVRVDVKDSPKANVQTAVNSPGAKQIIAEQVNIEVSPKLERKLTMEPVHLNKPIGERFESLFHGKLEAPYPVPSLRVEAYGSTVEGVQLHPMRTGLVLGGHAGKRKDHAFTTLHNAIGQLQLRVVTLAPEKLKIIFSVQE